MKGLSYVSIEKCKSSIDNFEKWEESSNRFIEELTEQYYNVFFSKLNPISRWWRKGESKAEFLSKESGWWHLDGLYCLEGCEIQREIIYTYIHSYIDKGRMKSIVQLISASNQETVLLNEELCKFVNEWGC